MANMDDDLDSLLGDFDQSPEFLALKESFVASLPEQEEKIKQAIASNDIQEAHRLFHSIKSTLGSFKFFDAAAKAATLEEIAYQNTDLEQLNVELPEFYGLLSECKS